MNIFDKIIGYFVDNWPVIIGAIVTIGLIGLLMAGSFRVIFCTFTDNYHMAYEYNTFTGELKVLEGSGYWVRNPIKYKIHSIEMRPMQVTVLKGGIGNGVGNGTGGIGRRILNAKLVEFNPKGFDTFMKWHGRGAGETQAELAEILSCYAFDVDGGKDCPFLTVKNQLAHGQGGEPDGVMVPVAEKN
jgi:hypothetical protein